MNRYIDIGEGVPILFLNGLGQRKEAWNPQLELSEHYRLIIPDLMGHSSNDPPDKPITLENMAIEVIELLDNLHIESTFICGLSLGGLLAQEIYRQRPEKVKGLIISNSTWYIPSYFANKIVRKSEKLFHEDKNKLISCIVEQSIYNKKFIEEAKQSFYINDSYLECALSGSGYNYFPTLLKVSVPTMLIGGRYDRVTPYSYNLFVFKWLIPKAKTVILNSGHLSNLECREEFNAAIRQFIGGEVHERA